MTAGAAQAEPLHDRNRTALSRISQGTYTETDLDLVRSQPELAAQVPDPTQPEVVTTESGGDRFDPRRPDRVSVASTTVCGAWARVIYTKKSLTGSVIYKYAHYVQYCRDGARVTRWQARYDYLAQSSWVVYWREQVANAQAGIGSYSAWSRLQRHIEYCVAKYGCYANTYPWSKITVRANGTYSYTGSNS